MRRCARRLFAAALSLAMLFSLYPAAFAEGEQGAATPETEPLHALEAETLPASLQEWEDDSGIESASAAAEISALDEIVMVDLSDETPVTEETVTEISVTDEVMMVDFSDETPATEESATETPVTDDAMSARLFDAAIDWNTAAIFQSAKNYGSASTDAFHDVVYTPDGGFVVMGYSFGESSDPAWTHTGSGNNNDAVLMKFDSAYKLQWAKAYGGEGVDVFNSVDALKDGRIVALGRSAFTSADESIKGVSWYLLVVNPENPDDYTEYRIGGTAGDQGYSVAATSDGGFVAAGWSASKAGFITSSSDRENYSAPVQLWEEQNGTNDAIPNRIAASGSDSVVVKFDKDGAVQYAVLHNYSVSESANNVSSPSERLDSVAVDSADNIYLVGYDAIAKNAQNAVIAKLNGADGSLLWHRSAGRAEQTVVPENAAEYIKAEYSGVAVLTDDSVVVTGTSTGDATTEEAWKITGVKDTLVARYSSGGELLFSDSFGTIDDNNSRPEGIAATPDGGYIVYGSQSGVMNEDALVAKGYDWGNYGGQDAILVKYAADNALVWSENYGSAIGDWINGMAVRADGEIIAVGESNGRNGVPAWGNNGGIDGVVLCTGLLPDAYIADGNSAADGNVTWADGSYTATGDGFGGADSIEVTVVIEQGKIASLDGQSRGDSAAYYAAATELHDTIVERQSVNVDAVSGATGSSNGIKDAAAKALGKSAAAYVDGLISAVTDAASAQSAADAYAELGAYSVSQLQNLTALQSAARQYGITLVSRAESGGEIPETKPVSAGNLSHNDTYYKIQNAYYKNINAEAFEERGLTGEGVKIAVIDSGLTPFHEDLDYSRVLEGYDYDSGAAMGRDSLTDNNGHGTAVTGILTAIADNNIGVAGLFNKLQVIPLKVTPVSPDKDTDGASSKLVVQAITDAVDKYQADVITTSLDVKDTAELAQAVAYAASKGVIITGAAGNSSKAENNGNDPYVYPASYEEVISVGAVDAKNKVRSNSQKNDTVFITAPGEGIAVLDLSLSGRCKLASGTSYASPMVAAMAVAAKQYDKTMTVSRFKTALQNSSVGAGLPGYDTSYGYGIVDFDAFVSALTNAPGDSAETYVLMNIPYADFYAAELNEDAPDVDAVTSATLNKPRTGTLAGGSYHVNSDGSDISGVIYPVRVSDMSALDPKGRVQDGESVAITVTNRGQETTTEYKGREALFESADYSYYVLDEAPAYYKELTVGADGAFSFGPVVGNASTVSGVTGEVTVGGRHADIEIKLTGTTGIEAGAAVSGVVLTDSDSAKYGLRHVVNVWRGAEIGWNLGELDLNGKTITNIRYITQEAVYDYPVTLAISNPGYVLMNIPYADFYAAELGDGAAAVDAVTSATLNKPRTGTLAGGSYHVNSDGSDISGVIYPVFVQDMSALRDKKQVTDSDSVSITVTNRGQETTTEYKGREALFESADYSYYVLGEKPARYKALTADENGAFTFGAVSGRAASVEGVEGRVTVGGRHSDIEIALTIPENGGITQGAAVSGVILTDSDGAKYGLRHVVNVWRGTEIGWNLGELDLNGKTITSIRYITQDAVYDYPVTLAISNPGYVLMNIPYADFYAAELDGGAVDAVTAATLKFENKSVAAGSYHVNDSATDEGSDLTGVTYPVFAPDLSALDATLEVKATDKKTFNLVTGREKTVTATEVEGADILFCAPSYSWFRLTEKPARYKALSADENGAFTFGAVSGRAAAVNDVTATINYETHHGNDAEIILTGTGIESDAVVGGVILTDSDGVKYGLPHVQGIWSRTQLGWPNTAAVAGKTFTNVRFILRDNVIDCPLEFTVKPKLNAEMTAAFTGPRELSVSGLDGMTNAKVTVTYTTGERPNVETHTVADNAEIVNGKVTLTQDAISGQAYTVKIVSDNYADKTVSNVKLSDTPDNPNTPNTPDTPDNPNTPDNSSSNQGGHCYVATAVYGSYDCPEVWTLRRFRDNVLAETWYGRLFIRLYYAISPTAVKLFGDSAIFQDFFRAQLDTLVSELQADGVESTPYEDKAW